VPTLGEAEFKLTTDTRDLESGMKRAEGVTQKAGQGMGTAMKVGGAAAGAALGGLSTMVITTGIEFDEMHDSIVTATGASGEALKGLESDAKAVFGAIPVDMDQAAMAIGSFNTLTGATGDELRDMSKKALNAARMLGEDAGPLIDKAGKAMNIFELEGAEASLMLDQMFVASQDTGIGMNALSGQIQTFGPIMKNAGISTETTIAFFGSLNKAGVDVTRVMPAINKTMRELAAEGVEDLEGALFDQFDAIKNAKTETEALNIASEAFGAEGAQRLMMAIRNEGLELGDLTAKLGDSEGAIEDNAAATDSMTEKFKVLTNKAKLMLEPLKGIGPALGPLGGMMRSMGPMTHGLGMAFGGLAGPKGIGAVRRVVPKAIMSMRALSMSMLTPPMGIVIAIGAVVVAIILVIKYWDKIQAFLKKYVLPMLKKVGAVFQEIGKVIKEFATKVLGFLKDHWKDIIGIIMGPLGIILTDSFGIRTKLIELFTGMVSSVLGVFGKLKDGLLGIWEDKILPFFTNTIPNFLKDNWTTILVGIFTGLPGILFMVFRDRLKSAFFEPMKSFFIDTGFGTSMKDWIMQGLEAVLGAVLGLGAKIPGLLWDGVVSAKNILLDGLGGLAGEVLDKLNPMNWFGSPGLFMRGEQIPQLIWDGIMNMKGWLVGKVGDLAGSIPSLLGDSLGAGAGLITDGANTMLGGIKKIPGVDKIPGPWSTLFESGLKFAAQFAKGIAAGQAVLKSTGETIGQGVNAGIEDALFKYTKFTVVYGDHLNDWLTHLPDDLRDPARSIGKAIVDDTTGTVADAFEKYIVSTGNLGDHLNDWLTHLPEEIRPAARAIGAAMVDDTSAGIAVTQPTLMGQVVGMTQSTLEAFVAGMGGPEAIERLGSVGEYWQGAMSSWLGAVRNIASQGGVDAAIDYTEKLIEMLGENAGPATDALKDMLEELKLVRESELAGELDAEALATKLMDTIDKKAPEVESTGVGMMTGTGDVMKAEAITKAPEIGDALMQTLGGTLAGYSDQCSDWGGAVIAYTASGAFSYAAGDGASMMRETGQRLIDGMVAGLEAGKGSLFSTIQSIIAQAIAAAEAEAGVESPSTKFAKIGGEMGEGLTGGWAQSLNDFSKNMSALNPLTAGRPDWLGWLKGSGPAMQPTAGGGRVYNVTVNNPRPMAAEDSIRRRLVVLQHLGV